MLYKVASDSGGATVPVAWRYYVHGRIEEPQRVLEVLRAEGEAFLVTRDANASVEIQGSTITIAVKDTVYSFRSSTLFRYPGGYTPVNVWLTAQPDERSAGSP